MDRSRLRTHGIVESMIQRRLCLLPNIIGEHAVQITPVLVKSLNDKAVRLTRVPQLSLKESVYCLSATSEAQGIKLIKRVHGKIYCGFDKTSLLVNISYPDVRFTEEVVHSVVYACMIYKSIDPVSTQCSGREVTKV